MSTPSPQRGGAPVGYVSELDPIEAGAVLYLRLWCDGAQAQKQIERDFSLALGADAGASAYDALTQLVEMCLRHGRRPLVRHGLACKCLGADECCFANVIGAACQGERDDAMLIASITLRPDAAPYVVGLAETVGLALRKMAIAAKPAHARHAQCQTLH